MINILIVEDDKIQRENLSKMISSISNIYNVLQAATTETALKISEKNDIRLFYIDINLGNSFGTDLAYKIRENEKYKLTWIVFITAFKTYMIEAFKEIHCYDYIIKPYNIEKVKKMTVMLAENMSSSNYSSTKEKLYLIIDVKGVKIKIFEEEIIFIEVFLRTCVIHTKLRKYSINKVPLKNLLEKIKDRNIIQSHRSYITNINYIKAIHRSEGSWKIDFNGYSEKAYIGNKYKKPVLQFFNSIEVDIL